jgi:hypothetical protein
LEIIIKNLAETGSSTVVEHPAYNTKIWVRVLPLSPKSVKAKKGVVKLWMIFLELLILKCIKIKPFLYGTTHIFKM